MIISWFKDEKGNMGSNTYKTPTMFQEQPKVLWIKVILMPSPQQSQEMVNTGI